MKEQEIRILLIEDDEDDYILFRDLLKTLQDWEVQLDWAQTYGTALEQTGKKPYDICFVDYRLGEENGIDLIQQLIAKGFSGPLIIATGKGTSKTDIAAVKVGASDYLEKSNLNPNTLERCIRYNIERSRMLNQLKDTQLRLRELSVKLIDAQENERRIIAREVHDSIGSGLTAIKFALESKLDNLKTNHPFYQGISVEQILSMVQEVIEETRRISAKLRPLTLDDLGLIKTIGWMCRNFQTLHPNIRIRHKIGVEESDVPESLKTVVYRILQEALNNVAKHSQADTVVLSVQGSSRYLELEVRDNGQGFDRKKVESMVRPEGGMGLEGMRDRAEFTDGRFEIITRKGVGTSVRVRWAI